MDEYSVGEYIIYRNGEKYELGRVKSLREDGAFVAYHEGETGALTPYSHMHKLINRYCIKDTSLGGDYFKADTPQTETEIAKVIVHKMIDDAVIAEDAYPDLRQKMHDAVDEYEPQTDCETCKHNGEYAYCRLCGRLGEDNYEPQADCPWK